MATSGVPIPAATPGNQANAPDQPAAGGAKQQNDEIRQMRAELDQLRRTNEQLQQSERFWAERAAGGGAKPRRAEPEEDYSDVLPDDEDQPDETPDKLVDEFSANGIKALEKRGVLTKREAGRMIADISAKVAHKIVARTTRQIETDSALFGEFPELRDDNSEMFKATSAELRSMVAMDPSLKKSPAALTMAARIAKAKMQPPKRDEDGERRRRIEAQAGDTGRRSSRDGFQEEEDDALSPRQKSIISAMGIKEEDYIAAAKKGINMSSRGRGRR